MIKAGILGLGWWGQNLVRSVNNTDASITFVAGSVRRPERVTQFSNAFGLKLFENYDEMLKEENLQAIVLATPHTLHSEQIGKAVRANKHIFCEKPFTMNKSECEIAISEITEAGLQVGVGYNRRFHPSMKKMRKLIKCGKLGTPLHVEAMAAIPATNWMSEDDWRFSELEWPAGGITPMGVHQIDHMVELFGEISTVFCQSVRQVVDQEIDDTTVVTITFKNGMTGFLSTLLSAPPDNRFAVYGTAGTSEIQTRSYNKFQFRPIKGDNEDIDFGDYDMDVETLREELEAFSRSILEQEPFPISHDQIMHVVSVTDAIIESSRTGKLINVS